MFVSVSQGDTCVFMCLLSVFSVSCFLLPPCSLQSHSHEAVREKQKCPVVYLSLTEGGDLSLGTTFCLSGAC